MQLHFFGLVFLSVFTTATFGADHVGVVVRVTGDVQLLTGPSVRVSGSGPHAKFEDMFYSVKKATPGSKLENGNVIQAGKDAKARIIYKNGDQITVSPLTAYKVTWDNAANKESSVDLLY